MTTTDLKLLSDLLISPSELITDFTNHDKYLHDATDRYGKADGLVMAYSESDVIATINFCRERNIPVVGRGAGTGLSGGCVPSSGGIVLSTENINHITVDPNTRTAICGPGLITKALMDAASVNGLTYPPDPASYDESTLGGNVAENAGGLRCKRFGITRDYLIGMRVVTAEGTVLLTGEHNDYEGFNLNDLIVASEGTLAIITEIKVRLIKSPLQGDTILIAFNSSRDAGQTVADICGFGIIPTVLEFLDGDAAQCSNEYEKVEGLDNVEAILLIETSGEQNEYQTEEIKKICNSNNCSYFIVESKKSRVDQLWKLRRNLSKAVKEAASVRISEDVAVPVSQFPRLVDYVAEINSSSSLRINSFGHAGDGNLHVNFLSTSGSEADQVLIEKEIESLMKKTIELGGTLTGEHGIGLEKSRFLPLEFTPPTLDLMKSLKEIFDPQDILNPGKIFP